MIEEITTVQFKIPKTIVPVVCHTTAGESITGDIFLDVMGKWALPQLHEFFESETPFFPIRTSVMENPFLIARNVLVLVELISFATLLRTDTSILLSKKKPVVLHLQGLGSFQCEILIDTPDDRSRILDVLNHPGRFLSVIWNNTYSLVNKAHIFRAVEV
jgi:hypothetical protein